MTVWILGASRATMRGVNALDTSRRSRVWSGGSMDRNDMPVRRAASGGASREVPRSLLTRLSRRMREQSSCRPKTIRAPPSVAYGEASRSAARTG